MSTEEYNGRKLMDINETPYVYDSDYTISGNITYTREKQMK